ncbi:transposase, mutator type [Ruegeria sp. TrichCH4B]|nr:transposase, mutator type [Ruegeria sp. TrichCH4B]
MFKLGQCARNNWRKLRGFAHLAEVIQGINFKDGVKQTQPETAAA